MANNPVLSILLGLCFLALAVYQLYTGSAFGRWGRVSREESPIYFWFLVIIEIIYGVALVSRAV
jgi:hypothetical protein